jgi:tetratricopeptide (TPR) repeat protein
MRSDVIILFFPLLNQDFSFLNSHKDFPRHWQAREELAVLYLSLNRIDSNNLDAASEISIVLSDVYDDFAGAEEILRPLESTHGKNMKYLNNLAYALILRGNIQEATTLLDKVERLESHESIYYVFATATRGLLNIRKGNLVEGSRLYNAAARAVANKELSKQILQKKELEIGRWFKDRADKEKSIRHLEQAYRVDISDRIFTRKAKELIEEQT